MGNPGRFANLSCLMALGELLMSLRRIFPGVRIVSAIFLVVALFAGCAPSRGVYHTVRKGETLWRISYTYGIDIQDLAEVNNIKDPARIKAGQRLYIPGASSVKKVSPPGYEKGRSHRKGGPRKVVIEKGRFIWPLKGKVISGFGMRGDTMHDGIDIAAPKGTPIRAADGGRVVYSNDGMRGYGNVIIISHSGDFFTVYAHNDRNIVKEGEIVKKGAAIATVGSSGNASTPHLHFEIRHGKKTRNPLFFLP